MVCKSHHPKPNFQINSHKNELRNPLHCKGFHCFPPMRPLPYPRTPTRSHRRNATSFLTACQRVKERSLTRRKVFVQRTNTFYYSNEKRLSFTGEKSVKGISPVAALTKASTEGETIE